MAQKVDRISFLETTSLSLSFATEFQKALVIYIHTLLDQNADELRELIDDAATLETYFSKQKLNKEMYLNTIARADPDLFRGLHFGVIQLRKEGEQYVAVGFFSNITVREYHNVYIREYVLTFDLSKDQMFLLKRAELNTSQT